MASTRPTSPASSGDTPPQTTLQERTLIREVFATEFGGAYIEAVDVKTPELFNALTTKRLDATADDDNGSGSGVSLHSEVLKNTTDLLQRFRLAAPTFPCLGAAAPENMKTNAHALFWRATFCRYFCGDMGAMDGPRVWVDVRRLVVALGMVWENDPGGGREVPARARLMAAALYGARPARHRSRENALLWELMGLASAGLREEARHRDMGTWSVEVTARVGLWRRLFEGRKDSILRAPIGEDTGAYPKDVLPEYSEGEYFSSVLCFIAQAETDHDSRRLEAVQRACSKARQVLLEAQVANAHAGQGPRCAQL